MSICNATWIKEKNDFEAPVFRKHLTCKKVEKAVIDICGLGWYELYINGRPVTDAIHAPAVSTYENLNGKRLSYTLKDVFNSARVYYCRHDISQLMQEGKNLIAVMLGNGWFNQHEIHAEGDIFYGCPRLAFSLELTYTDKTAEVIESGTDMLAAESHIIRNNLYLGETQDLSKLRNFFSPCFDDSSWDRAVECTPPQGELTLQTCIPDKIMRTITPKLIYSKNGRDLYDVGENISGYIEFSTSSSKMIKISHAEELHGKKLSYDSVGGKGRKPVDIYYADGRSHIGVHPHFNWHGFRYFTVIGEIENPVCRVVHTDMKLTSSFESDSKVLNWLYEEFVRTQLSNTHGCIPSDCPHRERLGYTGDGQLCCESVMTLFDAKEMFKKWMQDIVDCQCVNGHVQHTAPFFGGGGGPCGWGGAIIVVPYFYYLQYGDKDFIRKYYPNILKWFEYIQSRCENGLVVREEEGGWCLGDWCVPDIKQSDFPEDFVNTCLLVKFYEYLKFLEKEIGVTGTVNSETVDLHKKAITEKYFSEASGSFCSGKFAADAFAVDIGLGDERTLSNLKKHYDTLGYFDTGIFGTDILLRVLFEHGMSDTAIKLLMSEKKNHSFGYMINSGATTLWENYNAESSHSHPMFGACVKLLPQYILGIRSAEPGWKRFTVSPVESQALADFKGHITIPTGEISVSSKRTDRILLISINVNSDATGEFIFRGTKTKLHNGVNTFEFSIQKGE